MNNARINAAPPISRLFGHLIDWVIGIVLYSVVFGSMGTDTSGGIFFGLVLFIAYIVLQVYMMSKSTSLGKRILGLKVYNKATGKPVGLGMMLVREIIGKAISSLVLCIGFLWILFDKDSQGWHDKLIGSIVCKEETDVVVEKDHQIEA